MARERRRSLILRFRSALCAATWAVVGLCVSATAQTDNSSVPFLPEVDTTQPGGHIRADATVEPRQVRFGDTVEYRIAVDWQGDYRIDTVAPPADLPGFLIVSKGIPEQGTGAGETGGEFRQTFVLRAVQTGTVEIPPFEVRYTMMGGGKGQTLLTPATQVEVEAPEKGATKGELEPLAPAQVIPFDWTLRNIIYGGSAAVLLLLGWLAWVLMRRLEARRVTMRPPPPPRPAHLIAYEELDSLAQRTWLRDGRFKLFFTELSEILRRYLQNRYGHPALDWTSFEILEALERHNEPDSAERSRLAKIFEVCDLVKFAKWVPPEGMGEQGLEEARRFVDATAPVQRQEVA